VDTPVKIQPRVAVAGALILSDRIHDVLDENRFPTELVRKPMSNIPEGGPGGEQIVAVVLCGGALRRHGSTRLVHR
jgi:hypothetical protein